jgi:hypothetical protein
LFHQTWAPAKTGNNDHGPAPANEDTNDRTRAGKRISEKMLYLLCFFSIESISSNVHLNDMKRIYCANICSIFFKGPLDRYYE